MYERFILLALFLLLAPLVALPVSAASGITQIDGGYKITPISDVTVSGSATLIQAADATRVTLSCTNTSGSVNVRWGSSAVTATTGQQIPFGSAIEIRNIGAVYMISEGTDVTVSCTKETN